MRLLYRTWSQKILKQVKEESDEMFLQEITRQAVENDDLTEEVVELRRRLGDAGDLSAEQLHQMLDRKSYEKNLIEKEKKKIEKELEKVRSGFRNGAQKWAAERGKLCEKFGEPAPLEAVLLESHNELLESSYLS